MTRHTMGSWSRTDDSLDLGTGGTAPCEVVDGTSETASSAARVAAALHAHIHAGWRHLAACAGTDPDIWFESETEDETPGEPSKSYDTMAPLLAICASCPVRRSCLASALLRFEFGVWAGTTPEGRQESAALLATGHPAGLVLDELLIRVARKGGTVQRPPVDAGQPGRAA